MKKFIQVLSILLFFQHNSFANEILWDKCNGYANPKRENILEDTSGNLYIFGNGESYNYSIYMDKYDKNMQLIWHEDADSNEYFINYIDDNLSYFSFIQINDTTTLIRKYNAERNLVWASDTIHRGIKFLKVLKTKDNRFLFAQGFAKQSYIVCLDDFGQIKWHNNFYISTSWLGTPYNYTLDILENTDHSILTIEDFYLFSSGLGSPSEVHLTLKQLTDSSGNILKSDTSYFTPLVPSNFAIDFVYNYPFFTKNTSSYYPEFFTVNYYQRDEVIFKVSDVNMDIVNVDTIKNYLNIPQENVKKTINDSTYYLIPTFKNQITDSINYIKNQEIEFLQYNLKGERKWNYTLPFRINFREENGIIYQLEDKKFLIELYDKLTKEIHRILIDNFEIKWITVTIDSTTKNQEILYANLSSNHILNSSNRPTTNYGTNQPNSFYKIQSFYRPNDTADYLLTNYIYNIDLQNGSTQRYMQTDSFALPFYYYKDIDNYYFHGVYYAINFFKVLPDNKLFLSVFTEYKCTPDIFNSYLLIFGNTASAIQQNKIKDGKMNIFPNPNNGIFTIAFESNKNSTLQLQLIDVAGNIIYQENKIHQNKSELIINQTNLAKGIYWIKLSDGNDVYSNGIIIK